MNVAVARHDVLRTFLLWSQVERPLQVVLRTATVPVQSFPDEEATEPQLLEAFRNGHFPLSLDTAPLMCAVTAFDPANDRWLLLLLTHHLVLDHISMGIVVNELRTLMADPAATLPPAIPYRNFVAHTLGDPQLPVHHAFFNRFLTDVIRPTAPFGLHALPPASTQTPGAPDAIREGRLASTRSSPRNSAPPPPPQAPRPPASFISPGLSCLVTSPPAAMWSSEPSSSAA